MDPAQKITWDEVEHAAAKLFNIWVDGNELKWAEEVWRLFAVAGLTGAETLMEETASKLRLATLARVYHEFCGLAWEEDPDWPANYLTEDLEIDPVALGILAGGTDRRNEFEELTDDVSLLDEAILAVVDSHRTEIFDCLKLAYGNEFKLYTRMWHTRSDDAEKDSEGDEFELTGGNTIALEYVTNGFRSDHVPTRR
jgi:hypothetical protein